MGAQSREQDDASHKLLARSKVGSQGQKVRAQLGGSAHKREERNEPSMDDGQRGVITMRAAEVREPRECPRKL